MSIGPLQSVIDATTKATKVIRTDAAKALPELPSEESIILSRPIKIAADEKPFNYFQTLFYFTFSKVIKIPSFVLNKAVEYLTSALNGQALTKEIFEEIIGKDEESVEKQHKIGAKLFQTYLKHLSDQIGHSSAPECDSLKPHKEKISSFLISLSEGEKLAEKLEELKQENAEAISKAEKSIKIHDLARAFSSAYEKNEVLYLPLRDIRGHSILLRFHKGKSLSFINCDSLDKHRYPSLQHEFKNERGSVVSETKYQQFITYEGVDKDTFGSEIFFQALIEALVLPQWRGAPSISSSASDLLGNQSQLDWMHNDLVKSIKGKLKAPISPSSEPDLYLKNTAESAVFDKSYTAALFYELQDAYENRSFKEATSIKKAYKTIKYLLTKQVVQDYYSSLKSTIKKEKEKLANLKDKIAKANEALKEYGDVHEIIKAFVRVSFLLDTPVSEIFDADLKKSILSCSDHPSSSIPHIILPKLAQKLLALKSVLPLSGLILENLMQPYSATDGSLTFTSSCLDNMERMLQKLLSVHEDKEGSFTNKEEIASTLSLVSECKGLLKEFKTAFSDSELNNLFSLIGLKKEKEPDASDCSTADFVIGRKAVVKESPVLVASAPTTLSFTPSSINIGEKSTIGEMTFRLRSEQRTKIDNFNKQVESAPLLETANTIDAAKKLPGQLQIYLELAESIDDYDEYKIKLGKILFSRFLSAFTIPTSDDTIWSKLSDEEMERCTILCVKLLKKLSYLMQSYEGARKLDKEDDAFVVIATAQGALLALSHYFASRIHPKDAPPLTMECPRKLNYLRRNPLKNCITDPIILGLQKQIFSYFSKKTLPDPSATTVYSDKATGSLFDIESPSSSKTISKTKAFYSQFVQWENPAFQRAVSILNIDLDKLSPDSWTDPLFIYKLEALSISHTLSPLTTEEQILLKLEKEELEKMAIKRGIRTPFQCGDRRVIEQEAMRILNAKLAGRKIPKFERERLLAIIFAQISDKEEIKSAKSIYGLELCPEKRAEFALKAKKIYSEDLNKVKKKLKLYNLQQKKGSVYDQTDTLLVHAYHKTSINIEDYDPSCRDQIEAYRTACENLIPAYARRLHEAYLVANTASRNFGHQQFPLNVTLCPYNNFSVTYHYSSPLSLSSTDCISFSYSTEMERMEETHRMDMSDYFSLEQEGAFESVLTVEGQNVIAGGQTAIIKEIQEKFEIPSDTAKELLMIVSDKKDIANRVLSFAKNHPLLLTNPLFRKLFYRLLFTNGVLDAQLEENSEFIEVIGNHFKSIIGDLISNKKPYSASIVNLIFGEVCQYIRKGGNQVFFETLVSIHRELHHALKTATVAKHQNLSLGPIYVAEINYELADFKDIASLKASKAKYEQLLVKVLQTHFHLNGNIPNLLDSKKLGIYNHLLIEGMRILEGGDSPEKKQAFLNDLCNAIAKDHALDIGFGFNWYIVKNTDIGRHASASIFSSYQPPFEVKIEGLVDSPVIRIPKSLTRESISVYSYEDKSRTISTEECQAFLKSHPLVQKICKGHTEDIVFVPSVAGAAASSRLDKVQFYSPSSFIKFEVNLFTKAIVLTKKKEDQEYFHVSLDVSAYPSATERFVQGAIDPIRHLVPKNSIAWMRTSPEKDIIHIERPHRSLIIIEVMKNSPLQASIIYKEIFETLEGKEEKIISTGLDEGNIALRKLLTLNGARPFKETDFLFVSTKPADSFNIETISCKGVNLDFEIENRGGLGKKAYSRQYSGYYLTTDLKLPLDLIKKSAGEEDHSLVNKQLNKAIQPFAVLANSAGHKKVIFSFKQIQDIYNALLRKENPEAISELVESSFLKGKRGQVVALSVINGEFVAENTEERLLLALLYCCKREYAKAFNLLEKTQPIEKLSANESLLIDFLNLLPMLLPDKEAQPIAVYAFALKAHADFKFPATTEADQSALNPDPSFTNILKFAPFYSIHSYISYINRSLEYGALTLSPELEKAYLRGIVKFLNHFIDDLMKEGDSSGMDQSGLRSSKSWQKSFKTKALKLLKGMFINPDSKLRAFVPVFDLLPYEMFLKMDAPDIEDGSSALDGFALKIAQTIPFLPYLASRLQELEKGALKLGTTPAQSGALAPSLSSKVVQNKEEEEIEINSLIQALTSFSINQAIKKFDAIDCLLISIESANTYLMFYEIARNGTKKQKDKLQRILSFNASRFSKTIFNISFLKSVMQNPSAFPTIEKYLEIIEEQNNCLKELEMAREAYNDSVRIFQKTPSNKLNGVAYLQFIAQLSAQCLNILRIISRKRYLSQYFTKFLNYSTFLATIHRLTRIPFEKLSQTALIARFGFKLIQGLASHGMFNVTKGYWKKRESIKVITLDKVLSKLKVTDRLIPFDSASLNEIQDALMLRAKKILNTDECDSIFSKKKVAQESIEALIGYLRDLISSGHEISYSEEVSHGVSEDLFDEFKIILQTLKKLEELKESTKDANVALQITKEIESLKDYLDLKAKTVETYTLFGLTKDSSIEDKKAVLSATRTTINIEKELLTQDIKKQEDALKDEKQEILLFANKVTKEGVNKDKIELIKRTSKKTITWEELTRLFYLGSYESFAEATLLSEEDNQKLFRLLSSHYVKATGYNQLKAVQIQLNKLLAVIDKNIESEDADFNEGEIKIAANGLVEACLVKRHYSLITQNRRRLLFELGAGYMYRPKQIEKIDEISGLLLRGKMQADGSVEEVREILAEMPTGFGKTALMLPSFNAELAKDHLIINTWPASLERTNTLYNQSIIDKSFEGTVDALRFERSATFTSETVNVLYEALLKNLRDGTPINIRSESLRSLQHHALELLNQLKTHSSPELVTITQKVLFCLKIIRLKGLASIDEAHFTLDPLQRLIYTIGTKFSPEEEDAGLIEIIMDLLLKDPRSHILENTQAEIKDEEKEAILHTLAEKLADHFGFSLEIDPTKKKQDEEARVAFARVRRKEFLAFLMGKEEGSSTDVKIPEWIMTDPKRRKFALSKGMIKLILPACLKGFVDQHYGLSHKHLNKGKKRIEFAIAYEGSNTPKENESSPSQFQNPHETIAKTYFTYLHKGVNLEQYKRIVAEIKKEVREIQELGIPFSPELRELALAIFGTTEFEEIASINEKEFTTDTPSFVNNVLDKASPHRLKIIGYFIRKMVICQIDLYAQSLVSTPQNFRTMFAKSISVTATPQDKEAHGPKTHFVPMEGTSGQVTYLLFKKCQEKPVRITDIAHLLDQITEGAAHKASKGHAVIDVSGEYRGLNNKKLAERIAKQLRDKRRDDIEEVVFFDEETGRFKLLNVKKGNTQFLDRSEIAPEKCFAVYDQNRIFGSDLKLPPEAVGIVLLGKVHSTKTKTAQAVGRMRGIDRSQSVVFAINDSVYDDVMKEGSDFDALYQYLISQEAKERSLYNFEALKQQMDNEIRTALIDRILGLSSTSTEEAISKPIDISDALTAFENSENELLVTQSFDPFSMYAMAKDKVSTAQALNLHLEKCIKRVEVLKCFSHKEKKVIIERLKSYKKLWEPKEGKATLSLPETVAISSAYMGLNCEVMQEVEAQVQQEVETEVKTEKHTPLLAPRDVYSWSHIDLFEKGWDITTSLDLSFIETTKTAIGVYAFQKRYLTFRGNYPKLAKTIEVITFVPRMGYKVAKFIVKSAIITVLVLAALKLLLAALIIKATFTPVAFAIKAVNKEVSNKLQKAFDRYMIDPGWNFIKRSFYILMPKSGLEFYSVSEVMRKAFHDESAKLFTKDFLTTRNFYHITPENASRKISQSKSQSILLDPQMPFDYEQKPLYQILFIEDSTTFKDSKTKEIKTTRTLKAVAVDQNESEFLRMQFEKDRLQTSDEIASKRTRKLALYDIRDKKVISCGKSNLSLTELEKHSNFSELVAQGKILAGEIDYEPKELEYVVEKAGLIGIATFKKFFMDKVLATHSLHKKIFKKNVSSCALIQALDRREKAIRLVATRATNTRNQARKLATA